jgi:hypothetical protein
MSDVQAKQQFLRIEILEAGIDPGEFLGFLVAANAKKGENLELWKISELQEVVKAFKISKNIPLTPSSPNGQVVVEEINQNTVNIYDDNCYI